MKIKLLQSTSKDDLQKALDKFIAKEVNYIVDIKITSATIKFEITEVLLTCLIHYN